MRWNGVEMQGWSRLGLIKRKREKRVGEWERRTGGIEWDVMGVGKRG